MRKKFLKENLKERGDVGDLVVDKRTISNLIIET